MKGSELLAAIAAAPDDDAPRLVFADWLSEQGDPRGEHIALAVRLERAEADGELLPHRMQIITRISELVTEHGATWYAPAYAIAPAVWNFRRGMLEAISQYKGPPLDTVADELAALGVIVRSAMIDTDQLAMLNSRAARTFDTLVLLEPAFEFDDAMQIAQNLSGGRLRSIELVHPALEPAQLRLLLDPFALEHLAIVGGGELPEIRNRTLASLALAQVSLGELPASPLRTLSLDDVPLTPARFEDILARYPAIRRLSLRAVKLGGALVPALLASPICKHLRVLDLLRNTITDDDATLLRDAELPSLRKLTLHGRRLSSSAIEALRERFGAIELELS